jgi:hypothetical protein
MHRLRKVRIAGLFIVASACARNRGPAPDGSGNEIMDRPVRVHVVNHYKDAMEIVVVGAGTTQRLGLVAAGLTADFTVPQSIVGSGKAEFRAQPSGYGQLVRTDPLVIRPGNIVDFEIATNLIGTRANARP